MFTMPYQFGGRVTDGVVSTSHKIGSIFHLKIFGVNDIVPRIYKGEIYG